MANQQLVEDNTGSVSPNIVLDHHHVPSEEGKACKRPKLTAATPGSDPCPWPATIEDASGRLVHDLSGSADADVEQWLWRNPISESDALYYEVLVELADDVNAPACAAEALATQATPEAISETARSWAKGEHAMWGRVELDEDTDIIRVVLDPTTGTRYD